MVSLDDFNLVELVFGESGSTLELIFAASALIGGVLFLFWFLLMLVGGVGEGLFEGLFGIEFDIMSSDGAFDAMTFQGVMAFMMFFGLSGLYTLKSDGGDTLAIGVGGVAGLASMYGTGKIFQLFFSWRLVGISKWSKRLVKKDRFTFEFQKVMWAKLQLKLEALRRPIMQNQKMVKA